MNRSYSKIRHIQESNNKLETRVLTEQTNQNDFSKFPCLNNFKETSTPKGDKVKMGSGFWKNYQFYSNGRVLNIQDNSKAFFKCYDGDGIIVSQDPNDEPDM
jgi:hypothetical protein